MPIPQLYFTNLFSQVHKPEPRIGTRDKVHTQVALEALAALQEPEGATVKRRDAEHIAVDDNDCAEIGAFLKKF